MHSNHTTPRRRLTALLTLVTMLTFGLASPAAAGDGEMEIKVSGSLSFDAGACTAHASDYKFVMLGDVTGCVYGWLVSEEYNEETGEYQSRDYEIWDVSVAGMSGTWASNEYFYAGFDPDTGDQLWGGCEHPIIEGSGTGDFANVDGEVVFVDDIAAGTANYHGVVKISG